MIAPLLLIGLGVTFLGVYYLWISKLPKKRNQPLFDRDYFAVRTRGDLPSPLAGNYFIKPFRLSKSGTVNVDFEVKEKSGKCNVFLTDLFFGMDIEITYGARYFEVKDVGTHSKKVPLSQGEYAFVVDNRRYNSSGYYSINVDYEDYPNARFSDHGLALIEAGMAMLLVGLVSAL